MSFDPTYKGWKPVILEDKLTEGLKSFDPTYKGWKHGNGTIKPIDQRSFDPTYKGWKPV